MDEPLITPIPALGEDAPEALEQFDEEMKHQQLLKVLGGDPIGAVLGYHIDTIMAVIPPLCTALGAWLASRSGRKLRIKIGDIEVEAQTRGEAEKLLARAQEIQQGIQQRNQQPK